MGRRLIYKIEEKEENSTSASLRREHSGERSVEPFSEEQWEEVQRLQHWYNSEFTWSVGKLAFKRYVLFPNTEEFSNLDLSVWEIIGQRHDHLRKTGLSEHEVVLQLEKDRLVFVKWGGYFDGCLASGFTRVADNEWNAFLVCDFLLKASTLCPNATIKIIDEGRFVKTGSVSFRNGYALLGRKYFVRESVNSNDDDRWHIFSIVNPEKYDRHPGLKNMIPDFNRMESKERLALIRNWNWLGYGDGYDADGDDESGFDLDSKLKGVRIAEP